MNRRLLSELKKAAVILFFGIIYYIFVSKSGMAVPCLFNRITGFLCPACGITRMAEAIIKLDFASAYGYNKALFLTWPVIAAVFISLEVNYIRSGKRVLNKFFNILLWAEIVLLLVFGILRNLI